MKRWHLIMLPFFFTCIPTPEWEVVQCSEKCTYLYMEKTKKKLNKHMAQHRRANSSGQDTVVHLNLKDNVHSWKDSNVHHLDKKENSFKQGVRKAVYCKTE